MKPTTKDHVPPRNLFPTPPPTGLITVPACDDCNGGESKDDEWFRLTLSIREKVKGNADREAIIPTVERSMARSAAKGFARGVRAKIHHVPRYTPEGIYI